WSRSWFSMTTTTTWSGRGSAAAVAPAGAGSAASVTAAIAAMSRPCSKVPYTPRRRRGEPGNRTSDRRPRASARRHVAVTFPVLRERRLVEVPEQVGHRPEHARGARVEQLFLGEAAGENADRLEAGALGGDAVPR